MVSLRMQLRRRRDAALELLGDCSPAVPTGTCRGDFYVWLTFDEPVRTRAPVPARNRARRTAQPRRHLRFRGDNSLRLSYSYTTPRRRSSRPPPKPWPLWYRPRWRLRAGQRPSKPAVIRLETARCDRPRYPMWPYLVFKGLISAPPDIYLRFKGAPKRDIRSMIGEIPSESCGSWRALILCDQPLEAQIGIRNNTNQPLEMQIAPNPPPVNGDQAFKHHIRHLARRCFCHVDPDDHSPAPACRVSTPMRYNLSVIRDGWSPLILPFMRNTWVLG